MLYNYGSSKNSVIYLEHGGVPLGFMEDFNFQLGKVEFRPESYLIICSDGITEAMNKKGEMFGRDKILEFTEKNLSLPLKKFGDRFLKKVFRYSQGSPYHDDITLQILRRNSV
jgi:sigma-B regulation protein RsbU (phosphoserine phosphatase)